MRLSIFIFSIFFGNVLGDYYLKTSGTCQNSIKTQEECFAVGHQFFNTTTTNIWNSGLFPYGCAIDTRNSQNKIRWEQRHYVGNKDITFRLYSHATTTINVSVSIILKPSTIL